MIDKSFNNLSDSLNIEPLELEDKKETSKELATIKENNLEDKDYIQEELKSLIQGGLDVLDKLSQDISIGSKVRSHEVYFAGMNSVMGVLKELRELNKTEVVLNKENNKGTSPKNVTVNQFYDSNTLLDMINDAKENNSMNKIKAEFRIEVEFSRKNYRKKSGGKNEN